MEPKRKVRKLDVSLGHSKSRIRLGKHLQDTDTRKRLSRLWNETKDPFPYIVIEDFLRKDSARKLLEAVKNVQFHPKISDLFKFSQSLDLSSETDETFTETVNFFSTTVLKLMKECSGIKLNHVMDAFVSCYEETDFLLCHDDELESRRVAFMLYLCEDWQESYGGGLNLYSCEEECLAPKSVVKTLNPAFNKFVAFEVSERSFHEVTEVTKSNVKRYALTGWFYGAPVKRNEIIPSQAIFSDLKLSPALVETLRYNHAFVVQECYESWISEVYQDDDMHKSINAHLESKSEVLMLEFLNSDVFKSVCKALVQLDVDDNDIFEFKGPRNIQHFKAVSLEKVSHKASISVSDVESENNLKFVDQFSNFFVSSVFLQFLKAVTEFDLEAIPTKVSIELRKIEKGSYCLLRNRTLTLENSIDDLGCVRNNDDNDDPNFIDIIYCIAGKEWEEEWGGAVVYTDEEGDHVIDVPPCGNSLGIIVRTQDIQYYTSYVNSLANDNLFFCFYVTYHLDP